MLQHLFFAGKALVSILSHTAIFEIINNTKYVKKKIDVKSLKRMDLIGTCYTDVTDQNTHTTKQRRRTLKFSQQKFSSLIFKSQLNSFEDKANGQLAKRIHGGSDKASQQSSSFTDPLLHDVIQFFLFWLILRDVQ